MDMPCKWEQFKIIQLCNKLSAVSLLHIADKHNLSCLRFFLQLTQYMFYWTHFIYNINKDIKLYISLNTLSICTINKV